MMGYGIKEMMVKETYCVDDADGQDGHDEENDQSDDVVQLGSGPRPPGHVVVIVHQEAELEPAAVRLVHDEAGIGAGAVVLDGHLFELEEEDVGGAVGEGDDPAEEHGQFARHSSRNAMIHSGPGHSQSPPSLHCDGQHAHDA